MPRTPRPPLPLPLIVLLALLPACRGSLELAESDADVVLDRQLLEAPDPAAPGDHRVLTLYYGSGTDRNRPEYRDSVAIETPTVDASVLVDLGDDEEERNEYWGFGPDSFPLNARVWYPEGEGPFPLVLVVHGNHDMKDFSDPGYDYLGELLASRGYILASVDENFVNGGIRGENDARGWLLLKHLEQWRRFGDEAGNPFQGRVDLSRIALIGHSRGGEAVGHAAAFNRLTHYPDDANLTWDFGFDIRSVVAIAPVDGQYLPTDRPVPVENVNYLVFHGSHDGDVTSFHGLRQWNRVRFTDGGDWFKEAVYVYRANHGQWNTVWNAFDNGPRSPRILDLRGLLPPGDQRRFAEVFVSAFLEVTLRGDDRYRPLFLDHRVAGGWLPETMYITRFQDDGFRPLATFEEDIDVTTGSEPGVRLAGDSLSVWRESDLELRSRNRAETSASQENQAVFLGWSNRVQGADSTVDVRPASWTVTLPEGLMEEWDVGPSTALLLSLAPTRDTPPPRKPSGGEEAEREESREGGDEADEEPDEAPVDLTVEVEDAAGRSARVALRRYGPIRRPLETRILRRRDLEDERFGSLWELVLQTYAIPLADFVAANASFDPSRLQAVRLVFDRSPAGEVAVDDIGLSALDPAFTRVRVPPSAPAGGGVVAAPDGAAGRRLR